MYEYKDHRARKRAEEIFELRESTGATLKELGRLYGISQERVRQIVRLHAWLLQQDAEREFLNVDDINRLILPTRAYNCLRDAGIKSINQLQQTPIVLLLKIHNMGRKTVNAIRDELARIGKTHMDDMEDEVRP